MKHVLTVLLANLSISCLAHAQQSQNRLDNMPLETFEQPSEQFEHGTYFNDIRTAQSAAYHNRYASCAIWVVDYDALSGHGPKPVDPECEDVKAKVSGKERDKYAAPYSQADWAFTRQRFDCGERSDDILALMEKDDTPWGLFEENEINAVKGTLILARTSSLTFRDPASPDDANRYECVASEFD